MKTIRILRLTCLVLFAVSLVLMLQIPAWLRLRSGKVADPNATAFLSLQDNDLVQGELRYVLGCAASEQNGIWSTEIYSKGKKRYYVQWQSSGQMILYATNDAHEQLYLQQIMNETLAYTESIHRYQQSGDYEDLLPPTTTLKMQGVVARTPETIADQFSVWCSVQKDIDIAQCNAVYYISHTGFQRYGVLSVMGLCCLGVCLILLGVLPFVAKRVKQKMPKS